MTGGEKSFFEKEVERLATTGPLRQYQYVQIRQSKAFMEEYYSHKIDVGSLSAAAFMSRFHFIRIFQQVYGMTPRRYLRDLRISKAKELLRMGSSVTRVCLDVGYESVPTFSKAFKRGTGYSPTEYQAMHNSNPG